MWTKEQDELLKRKYMKGKKQELLELFPDKNYQTIVRKANRIGLKKNKILFFEKLSNPKLLSEMKLTNLEIGYIAGIIDGEGTIGLCYNKTEDIIDGHILVSNTSTELMNWLKTTLKIGRIRRKSGKKEKLRKKVCYLYYITRISEMEKLLELIKGFLIIKKEQAKLMLKFCEIKKNKERFLLRDDKGKIVGFKHNPPEEKEWKLYYKMKELNEQKGRKTKD